MTAAFDAQSSLDFTTSNSFTHTPVGTPRGVLVFIAENVPATPGTSPVSAVTYGGVSMSITPTGVAADSTGETGQVYAYFLGSLIPTAAQTVSITCTGGTSKTAWCITVTASSDTEIAADNKTSGDASNPSVTLATVAGFEGFVAGALFSGQNAPSSITAASGYALLTNQRDYGTQSAVAERSDSRSGANVTCGFTSTIEDVALVAVAVREKRPPRHPSINLQNPGFFFKKLNSDWLSKKSGILIPAYNF